MNASQRNPELHPHPQARAQQHAMPMADAAANKKQAGKAKPFEDDDNDSADDSDNEKPSKRAGRRKIKIEYIEDKNRRHITFSKRKAGIMKKAYELSTLTGTQVLLLVVSETGLVYTFTTVKLQPIVTKPEGKNLIQACLNAPDPVTGESSLDTGYNGSNESPRTDKKNFEEKKMASPNANHPTAGNTSFGSAMHSGSAAPSSYQQPAYASGPGGNPMPVGNSGYPYMGAPSGTPQYQQHSPQQPSQQQQQHQQQYGQMPGPSPYYGVHQPPQHPYMSQQPNYWHNNANTAAQQMQSQEQNQHVDRARGK